MRSAFKDEIAVNLGYEYHVESRQLMYSRFIDSKTHYGIKGGEGRNKDSKQTIASVFAKLFKGDSFYITPEVFYINRTDFNKNDSDEKVTHLGIGIRLGNQFQLENISLGVDWVGIGKGIFIFENDHSVPPYTVTLLNTYVGFAF